MILEAVGYALTILLGLSIGLMGAGGSILSVPILAAFFGLAGQEATEGSLAIVGVVSLVGALLSAKRGDWDPRTLMLLAPTSIVGAFGGRRFLLPMAPDPLLATPWGALSKDDALLVLFGLLMLGAAQRLLRGNEVDRGAHPLPLWAVAAIGLGVGLVTGILGAGGGFLLVPALVLGVGLPMTKAVGTSMALIALNCSIALSGALLAGGTPDWALLGVLIGIAMGGLALGIRLRGRLEPATLQTGFAWFIVAVALGLFAKVLAG